ncbi:MAG: AraC family transcriptional regulator [Spirochaetales bacterium]|nr:AraC family transcriptional regulator [Spirochaetales bacterium]
MVKNNDRTLLWQMIAGFAPFLLLLAIASGVLYSQSLNFIKRQANDRNIALIEEITKRVDKLLIYLEERTHLLRGFHQVMRLKSYDNLNSKDHLIDVLDAQKAIESYYHAQGVTDFAIYFRQSNMVLSPHYIMGIMDYLQYYRGIEEDAAKSFALFLSQSWHQREFLPHMELEDQPKLPSALTRENKKAMLYLQSFGTPQKSSGVIMVFLDSESMVSGFETLMGEGKGGIQGFDSEGERLFALGESKPIKNSGLLEYSLQSQLSGWMFETWQNPGIVYSELQGIRQGLAAIMLLTLASAILLSVYLGVFRWHAISTLIKLLGGDAIIQKGPWQARLHQGIQGISEKNKNLEERLQRLRNRSIRSVVYDLLNGLIPDQESLRKRFMATGREPTLLLQNIPFTVGILHGGISGELSENDMIFLQELENLPEIFLTETDGGDVFILAPSSMVSLISTRFIIHPSPEGTRLFWGKSVQDALKSFRSLEEAKIVLQTTNQNAPIGIYSEEDTHCESFYFPVDVGQRIVQGVLYGEHQTVQILLERLIKENFQKRNLSIGASQSLYLRLLGLKNEIISSQKKPIPFLPPTQLITEYDEGTFQSLTQEILSYVPSSPPQHRGSERMQEAMIYLENHYNNPNMCLCKISNDFKFSESHFSRAFKDATGLTFQEYLENLRLDAARNHLRDWKLSVHEIAQLTGFSSHSSFCRSFKRREGVSPSTYRRSLVSQKIEVT